MSYRLYGGLPDFPAHKTYALIHTDALAHNFSLLRETVRASAPAVRTVAVVKADAYGHGAPACVQSLLGEGCDAFAVSCIEEAVQVRETCTDQPLNRLCAEKRHPRPGAGAHSGLYPADRSRRTRRIRADAGTAVGGLRAPAFGECRAGRRMRALPRCPGHRHEPDRLSRAQRGGSRTDHGGYSAPRVIPLPRRRRSVFPFFHGG
ncbi:alanine racemase [Clostridium sp. CAG:448]|nr:alanine racemase [Clostridium sp. CAG:448]